MWLPHEWSPHGAPDAGLRRHRTRTDEKPGKCIKRQDMSDLVHAAIKTPSHVPAFAPGNVTTSHCSLLSSVSSFFSRTKTRYAHLSLPSNLDSPSHILMASQCPRPRAPALSPPPSPPFGSLCLRVFLTRQTLDHATCPVVSQRQAQASAAMQPEATPQVF